MQRNVLSEMLEWNTRKTRKPLVLMGARQVGKTWLLNEFAASAPYADKLTDLLRRYLIVGGMP